ncbi:MAG: hypothetical protein ABR511_11400 [Acidimicrobiales bacterium]
MSDQYGGGSGFTPMPGEPVAGPVARGPAPEPILNAMRLMLARAALGILSLIVLLATRDTLKSEILKHNRTADPARLDSLLNTAVVVGVVFGILFTVLYVILALQVRNGRNWARVVTFVLAGLGIVGALASLGQPEPALSRLLSIVGGLIDVAIIVMLTRLPSREYFRTAV